MKLTKLASIVIAATAAVSGVSSAASLSVNAFANTTVGLIGLSGSTAISGRAILISTTADISASLYSNLNSLLTVTTLDTTTSTEFNNALALAIGTTSATSVGIFRTATFTNGALSSLGSSDVGAVANNTYMVVVTEAADTVSGFGVYRGSAVPSLGAITFNPTNIGDTIGIGTSVLSGGIGYQLAPVVVAIPEPSAALLGAIGVLGLLRRRRI